MKKLIVASSILFFCVACTKDSDPNYYGTVKPRHSFDEIWINNREEPQHVDPTLVYGVPDGNLARSTFMRLVEMDPRTGKIIPELAERWEVLDGGKTYLFHMRKGLKWSDGVPLTAHDVEYSWKRLLDPATASQYQGLAADVIENGGAFAQRALHLSGFSGKAPVQSIQSFFIKHQVPIKIEERKGSNDIFVFLQGSTGEETKANREKMLDLLSKEHPWGADIKAQVTSSDVVGATALDDFKFQVKLVGPLSYFLLLAEFVNFAPVPKHVIEKFKAQGKEDQWVKPENIVVSGPFKIKEEQFKQYKIYEKNPNYWDADNVKLNRVKIIMVENETASLNSYKVGESDWIGPHLIPSEQIINVKNFKDYHNDPYLGVYYYIFNTKKKPLDDLKVRQALSLAIDRQKITEFVVGGGPIPYTGIVPDNLAGYKSATGEFYNPEKAKKLLEEAGYGGGKNFPKIKFMYDTKEVHRLVVQAVQEMWKQNLGIEVEPTNVEWKVYLDRLSSMNFEVTRQGWIGDFQDPYTFLELLKSTSGNNHTGWQNAEYDRLLEASNQETNPQKRFALLAKAEKIAIDGYAFLPIYLYTKTYMLKPYVKGFYPDYLDHHSWKYMWIDLDWKKNQ